MRIAVSQSWCAYISAVITTPIRIDRISNQRSYRVINNVYLDPAQSSSEQQATPVPPLVHTPHDEHQLSKSLEKG